MASKLQAIPSPKVKRMEERIVSSIEELMQEYLNESAGMELDEKKEIIRKIVRLSGGL
jgi:hypothetical protein